MGTQKLYLFLSIFQRQRQIFIFSLFSFIPKITIFVIVFIRMISELCFLFICFWENSRHWRRQWISRMETQNVPHQRKRSFRRKPTWHPPQNNYTNYNYNNYMDGHTQKIPFHHPFIIPRSPHRDVLQNSQKTSLTWNYMDHLNSHRWTFKRQNDQCLPARTYWTIPTGWNS